MEALFYTLVIKVSFKNHQGVIPFVKDIIRDVKYLSNHLKSVRIDIPANYQGGNHPSLNFHRFSVLKNSNFGQAILLPDGQMVII